LKQVFYSKAPETILSNIHIDSGHKPINAKFTFKSNDSEFPLTYADKNNVEFRQFAVFDEKSVVRHLEQKNEFEFRPAGLSFFSHYNDAIIRVEKKLDIEINKKQSVNEFAILFDGESEIKTFIQNLSSATKIDDLKKYTPFTEEDKAKKIRIQREYEELLLDSRDKDKKRNEIAYIKRLL
jgi:hypothetical protein